MAGTKSRIGRLPADEVAERKDALLDAALEELVEGGYDALTMRSIAERAGASKETLYSWFGNKEGLMAALIERNARTAQRQVAQAMGLDLEPRDVLAGFATNLLRLLLGESSIAINRAAMTSPALRSILLEGGRFQTGAVVEAYLAKLVKRGALRDVAVDDAFRLLYGLIVEDRQIRALLDDAPTTDDRIREHAEIAVDRFLALLASDDNFSAIRPG